jgi:predicted flavoprotein YhiN
MFVAGEMLDGEAPTGGYLLHAALSMGFAAGETALAWHKFYNTDTLNDP